MKAHIVSKLRDEMNSRSDIVWYTDATSLRNIAASQCEYSFVEKLEIMSWTSKTWPNLVKALVAQDNVPFATYLVNVLGSDIMADLAKHDAKSDQMNELIVRVNLSNLALSPSVEQAQ
jgi:hypothetical protein